MKRNATPRLFKLQKKSTCSYKLYKYPMQENARTVTGEGEKGKRNIKRKEVRKYSSGILWLEEKVTNEA